jgi:hypothetical protein
MKRNLLFFSLCLAMGTMAVHADDSIGVQRDTAHAPSRYDLKVEKRRQHWAALIPTQFVIQNAGNMGLLSAGIGWDYARHHLETHLMFGIIPKHQSTRAKVTMTLKENFIPWSIALTEPQLSSGSLLKHGWSFNPLTASLYVNTVFGHEFWSRQPQRYPSRYYEFMSTEFRMNLALGQRLTWQIPDQRRRHSKSVSLFYEVSTCDIYIRSKIIDHGIPLKDLFGLSLGVKIQTM